MVLYAARDIRTCKPITTTAVYTSFPP